MGFLHLRFAPLAQAVFAETPGVKIKGICSLVFLFLCGRVVAHQSRASSFTPTEDFATETQTHHITLAAENFRGKCATRNLHGMSSYFKNRFLPPRLELPSKYS